MKEKEYAKKLYTVQELEQLPKENYGRVPPKVWTNNDNHYDILYKEQVIAQ